MNYSNLLAPQLDTQILSQKNVMVAGGLLFMVCAGLSLLVPSDFMLIVMFLPVLLLAGALLFLYPHWTLVLTVAYVPLDDSGFFDSFIPGSLTMTKVLGALVLASFFFSVIFRKRPFRILDDMVDLTILLLAVVMLVSGLLSEYPEKSLDAIIRMFRIFAFYIAAKNLLMSPDFIVRLMWLMSVGAAFASAWGINEFFANRQVRVHDIRVSGINMNTNEYALLALMALFITLSLIPVTRRKWLQGVLIFNSLLITSGLVLSGSRGGLLALVITGAIYVWHHPDRMKVGAIILLLGVTSFPIWPDSIKTRLGLQQDTTSEIISDVADHSARRRLSYVNFSMQLIEEHPVIGIGYGTFSRFYPRSDFAQIDNPLTSDDLARVVHNTYLEFAVGMGFTGLFIYLALLIVTLRDLINIIRRTDYGDVMYAISHGFFLALIGFMVASAFLSIQYFLYLWLTLGVASSLRYFNRESHKQRLDRTGEQGRLYLG